VDEALSSSSTNAVQNKAVDAALNKKVDKVTGKGLSVNDFTNAYKEKLDGIEAGANKYELGDGAVTESTIAGGAVTRNKISNGAVSHTLSVILPAANWTGNTQSVAASGVTATNSVIVTPAPATYTDYVDNGIRCTTQGEGTLNFACDYEPSTNVTANVLVIHK